MATLRIPVKRNVFDYTMQVESLAFTIRLYLNYRIDSWLMDIPGAEGIRLVGGIDLLSQFRHLEVPPGEIRIMDLDDMDREPTKENFGDRVILVYIEP